jgi:hypothetical protein
MPDRKALNVRTCRELVLRAVQEALEPLGITQSKPEGRLLDGLAKPTASGALNKSGEASLLSGTVLSGFDHE